METIKTYIQEKLIINKNIKSSNPNNSVEDLKKELEYIILNYTNDIYKEKIQQNTRFGFHHKEFSNIITDLLDRDVKMSKKLFAVNDLMLLLRANNIIDGDSKMFQKYMSDFSFDNELLVFCINCIKDRFRKK